ncbi:MAG: hypothetical protein WBC22_10895, partial [Sedimentisphaerales bacterium]
FLMFYAAGANASSRNLSFLSCTAETPNIHFILSCQSSRRRQLGRDYGMLAGISSGANVWVARQLSSRIKGNIATVLPDRAERYFTTALL